MNIEEIYQGILQDLSAGGRALRRYTPSELKDLETALQETTNDIELKKVICLVEHSMTFYPGFAAPLLEILKNNPDTEILVFALNGARKHIVAYHQQQGKRLEYPFLEVLKNLLYSKHPEVVEWTLRTIEEIGAQGIFFKKELNNIKPPPWKWFNEHNRSIREIIAMLEMRWSQR